MARIATAETGPYTSLGEVEMEEELLRSLPQTASILEQSTLGAVEDMTEEYEDDFDAEAEDTYDDDFDEDEVADEVGEIRANSRTTPSKPPRPTTSDAAYDDDIIEEDLVR
uniref:Uncharacterized protein n=1 Tax=Tetraselmis chuii TaxID=63592 RepID=A0A7S1T7P2_9CHLO